MRERALNPESPRHFAQIEWQFALTAKQCPLHPRVRCDLEPYCSDSAPATIKGKGPDT